MAAIWPKSACAHQYEAAIAGISRITLLVLDNAGWQPI
jgi:hypothetical protein